MTFPTEVSVPLLKEVKAQAPNAVWRGRADQRRDQHHRQLVLPAVRQCDIRRAWRWRWIARRSCRSCSRGRPISAAPCFRRRAAVGDAEGNAGIDPRLRPDINANREEARKLMQKAGYGPDKRLAVKVSTRNIPVYRDPAVILIDQIKSIYIDASLTSWIPRNGS